MVRFLLAICLLFGLSAGGLQAQNSKSILVLDASGSMWGRIDGTAKIAIAQQVIGGLLDDLPEDRALGLNAYGHRRKGDCNDIETLVPPGVNNREAIRSAVNALKPKGKTPLSEAVVRAAREMSYTEEAATVILVSDGLETCAADPCAIAKELNETGVDFTAHVVGFDLATEEERAQLQCIADNTGGKFLTASNADELTRALKQVTSEPAKVEITREAPELRPYDSSAHAPRLRFTARFGANGLVLRDGVAFSLVNTKTGRAASGQDGAFLDLKPGIYRVTARLSNGNSEISRDILVNRNTDANYDILLPLMQADATLSVPDRAALGARIEVNWTGPDGTGDYLATARLNDQPGAYITFAGTQEGARLGLDMPEQPGIFEIRYFHAKSGRVLASRVIEVISDPAALNAPSRGAANSALKVSWAGPNRDGDYLSIAPEGAEIGVYATYVYTENGAELDIPLPPEPGRYELRYMTDKGRTILTSMPIEVTPE